MKSGDDEKAIAWPHTVVSEEELMALVEPYETQETKPAKTRKKSMKDLSKEAIVSSALEAQCELVAQLRASLRVAERDLIVMLNDHPSYVGKQLLGR